MEDMEDEARQGTQKRVGGEGRVSGSSGSTAAVVREWLDGGIGGWDGGVGGPGGGGMARLGETHGSSGHDLGH